MRRKDRQIRDKDRIDGIIKKCDCCRLGLADGVRPYIVPLNFGYMRRDGRPVFYFHGANEGRKLELIRKNGAAGFELDTGHGLNEHEKACGFSFRFQSVIGTGAVGVVTDPAEKLEGMKLIMERCTGHREWEFTTQMLEMTAVIRLDPEEMTCKEHE